MLLDRTEVAKALATYPDWEIDEKQIHKRFLFPSFLEAIAFVNNVARVSEKAEHHPSIDIRYNKVHIMLTSRDEGGLSEKDIKLARIIDDLV